MLGYAKELESRYRESYIAVLLTSIIDWTVGDELGMWMEIKILEKSFSNGRNGRNYLQFNTVRKLRVLELDI